MNKDESLVKTNSPEASSPVFVEAEQMFDKLAAITRETAAKAFDFFMARGSQFGSHLEDWLRAESETLRTAPVKITDTKDIVNVMIAVPGFKANEIEVSVKEDRLIVSGETTEETRNDEENTYYNEWRSNRFLRELTLPCNAQTENIVAELKNGVLKLSLKKMAEVEATKVAVKSA